MIVLAVLIAGVFVVYRITKPYTTSLVDLKSKKEKELNEKRFKADLNLSKKEDYNNIIYNTRLEIIGNKDFEDKIKQALRILWTYDREGSFRMVRNNVFKIIQSNRTTFFYHNGEPVIEISDSIYKKSSLTYLASVIAHMGWHAQYLKNKNKKNIEVPHPSQNIIDKKPVDIFGKIKRFDDLYKVEEEAFNYQISVLEKINAPLSEIRFLKKRNYKDFSPAHDGNYFIEF